MEIYFCMKRDFSKVWKVSLINETIETYSGFATPAGKKLDATGIWSYELSSMETGSKENDLFKPDNGNVKIYPNPTLGQLNITLSSIPLQNAIIEIYNAEGRSILSKVVGNTSCTIIDLTGNPKGLYFIKLLADGEIINAKFCLN